jgi:hypothetical protein
VSVRTRATRTAARCGGAVTRLRRSMPPARPGGSAMSRPPAAPSSNGWRASLCRGSRCSGSDNGGLYRQFTVDDRPRKARQKTNARSLSIKKDYPILQVAVRRLRGRPPRIQKISGLPQGLVGRPAAGCRCGKLSTGQQAAGNFDRSGARRAQDGCARRLYRHAATTFGRAAGRCAPRPCPA